MTTLPRPKPPPGLWYLKRGGIPTRAAAWKSADPPDWFCNEGDREWRPFEAREERKIA